MARQRVRRLDGSQYSQYRSPMILLVAALLSSAAAAAVPAGVEPPSVLLWPQGAPGALGAEDVDRPSLQVYRAPADKASGAAVVVCPGGSYARLAMDHEGRQVAEWLNGHGVTAVVLKYRLGPRYHHPAPLQDAQRALRWVRANAGDLGVRADAVGIWGFSAGGHLAATAATKFDDGDPQAADPLDRPGSRPDFAILAYPVISLVEEYAHAYSRSNLLGPSWHPDLAESLSAERQVTARTPPTFIFYTDEDPVRPENGVAFYLALRRAKVPAELHIYERGKHGLGLAADDPVVSTWTERLRDWLRLRGFIRPGS
jgi:acetyl esterase/lipase